MSTHIYNGCIGMCMGIIQFYPFFIRPFNYIHMTSFDNKQGFATYEVYPRNQNVKIMGRNCDSGLGWRYQA